MGRSIETPASVRRLEQLYRRYHRRVRWILRGRGIADQELDDAVHDVFLAIHRRYAERPPQLDEALWVMGVARNIAFSVRRGNARRQRMLDRAPEPTASRPPDEELARQQAWSALQSFLDTLDDKQREAFVLMDVLGMATAEIAELTRAPANTVSSRVRLARRRFDRHFAGLRGQEAAFVRAARAAERPSSQQRRRTWAGIVAAIPQPAPLVATSAAGASITKWVLGGAVATALATTVAVRSADRAGAPAGGRSTAAIVTAAASTPGDPHRAPSVPSTEDGKAPARPSMNASAETHEAEVRRPSTPAPDPSTGATSTTPPQPPHRAPGTAGRPRAAPHPEPPASNHQGRPDDLSHAVALLRTAEAHLSAGDAAAALAAIDDYDERFDAGPLHRDRLRIERDAACTAERTDRARRAHARLVAMKLASTQDFPCP